MNHIDIISVIGEKCDDNTRYNLCCSYAEYWKTQREFLKTLEVEHYHETMKDLVRRFPTHEESSVLCRIRYMKKVFNYCIRYNHIIESKVRTVLLEKLKDTREAGLSKKKYKYYTKIFKNPDKKLN